MLSKLIPNTTQVIPANVQVCLMALLNKMNLELRTIDDHKFIQQANSFNNEPFWYIVMLALKDQPSLGMVLTILMENGLSIKLKTSEKKSIFTVCIEHMVPLHLISALLDHPTSPLNPDEFSLLMQIAFKHDKTHSTGLLDKLINIIQEHLPVHNALIFAIYIGHPGILKKVIDITGNDNLDEYDPESLMNHCVHHKNALMLHWLSSKNIFVSMPFIIAALEIKNDKLVRLILSGYESDLHFLDTPECTLTECLIRLQRVDLIIEFDLLRKTHNFERQCLRDISVLFLSPTLAETIKNDFAIYLLRYLESKQDLPELTPGLEDVLKFSLTSLVIEPDKYTLFNGESLTHALNRIYFSHVQNMYMQDSGMRASTSRFHFDINAKDHAGLTILAKLIHKKNELSQQNCTAWLLAQPGVKQTNLDAKESSLIHLACEQEDLALVALSLKHKQSIFKPRKDGLDAMDLALLTENKDVLEYLIEKIKPRHISQLIEKTTWRNLPQNIKDAILPHDNIARITTMVCSKKELVTEKKLEPATESLNDDPEHIDFLTTLNWKLLFDNANNPNWTKRLKQHCILSPVIQDTLLKMFAAAPSQTLELVERLLSSYRCAYNLLRIPSIDTALTSSDWLACLKRSICIGDARVAKLLFSTSFIQQIVKDNQHDHDFMQALTDMIIKKESIPDPFAKITEIARIFSSIKDGLPADTPAYLVGSINFALLENSALEPTKDIDVLSDTPCSNVLVEAGCFLPSCFFGGRLYKQKFGTRDVDLFVTGNSTPEVPLFFLLQNSLTRDFTISALYCTNSGDILDPSVRGIDDFRAKQLDTIEPATKSLSDDPIRVIRAIKWIARGFTPTDSLDAALRAWEPGVVLKSATPHMRSIWKKTLAENDSSTVFEEYGLNVKLSELLTESSGSVSPVGFFSQSSSHSTVHRTPRDHGLSDHAQCTGFFK